MAAADLVAEWFIADLLQAAVAARGIFGVAQGPWSAGTGAALLLERGGRSRARRQQRQVKGGPGALTRGDGGRRAPGGRGDPHRTRRSPACWCATDAPPASCSRTARRSAARAVVSNADPRRTLLDLVDPIELDPSFLTRIRNYRARGTSAKVNLALSALPVVPGVARSVRPQGPRADRTRHRLPGARVRRIEVRRASRRAVPRHHDPDAARPFARAGGRARDVGLRAVRALQPRRTAGRGRRGGELGRDRARHARALRAGDRAAGAPPADHHAASISNGRTGSPAATSCTASRRSTSSITMRPGSRVGAIPDAHRGTFTSAARAHTRAAAITGAPGQNAAREIVKDLKA